MSGIPERHQFQCFRCFRQCLLEMMVDDPTFDPACPGQLGIEIWVTS